MSEQLSFTDAMNRMIESRLYEMNTCLPGTIVSYANGRAKVQPTPKKRFADGSVIDFPILQNVRVCWPAFAGGQAGVKGPVRQGDSCLLIFAQQAVDNTDDLRHFDLSDAYCVMTHSGAVGAGTDNSTMTMFFGSAYIRISEGGLMTINAPAGVNVTSPSIKQSGEIEAEGKIKSATDVFAVNISLKSHTHSDPQGGTVGPPQ